MIESIQTTAPKAKAGLLINLAAVVVLNLIVYSVQLVDTNAYAGFEAITIDLGYIATLVVSMLLVLAMMPTTATKPSDFFLLLYGLFVPVPFAVFHTMSNDAVTLTYAVQFAIVLFPMAVVAVAARFRLAFRPVAILGNRGLELIVIAFCLVAATAAILTGPSSSGFGLENMYERRLDARDIFAPGSLLAYAISISANCLAPYVGFVGGFTSRRWMLAVSFVLGLSFFYVYGVKAPFAYIFLAYAIGVGLRNGGARTMHRAVFWSIWAGFAVFVVEFLVLGESLTAEFLFRRMFPVPAHVLHGYFDLISNSTSTHWSIWTGAVAPDGVAYLVGDVYFGNDQTNANTNAFVYALAAAGIPGYFAALALVCASFCLFDAIHRVTHNATFMYLGFAFSILLVEQAATTALVSSGIALLTVLSFFAGNIPRLSSRRNMTTVGSPGSASIPDYSGTNRRG